VRIRTLLLFLIGDRRAILDLAADRRALWVGLLFVLSAGFAREHDGQDLLREPWHLLVPLGASLAASFLLFLVACGPVFLRGGVRPPFFSAYRSFLTLFWLTAPLAWLYAVPYERFLSPGAATEANLWTLALVATWRVALMVRVISVITDRSAVSPFFLVMAFADAVALAAVLAMPKPIISVMGGVRLSESENVIQGATLLVLFFGFLSAPVWGIGGLIALATGKPVWQVPASTPATAPPGRGVWALAALSLAIWLPILPRTQGEQQLRSRVERDMKAGRIADGLDVMSAHAQSDFPPHWDPPPRIGYGEQSPHVLDVLELLLARDRAPWVQALYVDKLRRYIGKEWVFFFDGPRRGTELARMVRILQQVPEGPDIAAEHAEGVKTQLSYDRDLSAEDREHLNALLKLAEKPASGRTPE
jgi:hypothetical protein